MTTHSTFVKMLKSEAIHLTKIQGIMKVIKIHSQFLAISLWMKTDE